MQIKGIEILCSAKKYSGSAEFDRKQFSRVEIIVDYFEDNLLTLFKAGVLNSY